LSWYSNRRTNTILTKWPIIDDDHVEVVIRVLRDGPLVKGPLSEKLGAEFARYIGVPYCRCVSSCTHAIHLALRALGIRPGDEVLVPNLTYCGSVSPIVNTGATPVFVDVKEDTYNLCLVDAAAKRTSRSKAVIPVHLHGYPCDIADVRRALPGLLVVEDACQAHGATRSGEYAGSWGDIGCFSLNQVKPLYGGQGGLVVTKDPDLWNKICDLASPGHGPTVGLSYEITELSAAIALTQLSKLEYILNFAQANYVAFRDALRPHVRHCVQACEVAVRPTWHKLRIRVPPTALPTCLDALERSGVPYETWPGTLVSQRSEYTCFEAVTPVSERIMASSFVLGNERFPFHTQAASTVSEWADLINQIYPEWVQRRISSEPFHQDSSYRGW